MPSTKFSPSSTFLWRSVGVSVRGANHIRTQKPNQDAMLIREIQQFPEPALIATIADGHGGAHYFRSEVGSQLAVENAISIIERIITSDGTHIPSISIINHLAVEQLPKLMHREWQKSVSHHIQQFPFTKEELALTNESFRRKLQKNTELAYGTTLLVVAITSTFILYLQLGDGDILVGSDEGVVSRPIPRDERLFANETTSMSMKNAWQNTKVVLQVQDDQLPSPALILMATDGYSNSFRDDTSFSRVVPDFLKILRTNGASPIKRHLAKWLSETSQMGSGDDITLTLIFRGDILPNVKKKHTIPNQIKQPTRKRHQVRKSPPWRRPPTRKKKKVT